MRHSTVLMLAASAALGAHAVRAATPIYSFETLYNVSGNPDPAGTRPDGFGPNGGGTTVAQAAVGATDGTHSLLFSMIAPATFSGAQTVVIPAVINDPSTFALVCDVTIPDSGAFTGAGFVRFGITEFGSNPDQVGPGGGSAQTTSEAEANLDLTPGTYHITVPLIARGNPITFDSNVPFSSIFGPDPNTQLTPTSIQYYINKSNTSAITVYIDNVRLAKPGDVNGDGRIDPDDYAIMDRGAHTVFAPAVFPGWTGGDLNSDGHVNAADYLLLDQAYLAQLGGPAPAGFLAQRQSQFGDVYAAALLASTPEPSAAALLLTGLAPLARRRR